MLIIIVYNKINFLFVERYYKLYITQNNIKNPTNELEEMGKWTNK